MITLNNAWLERRLAKLAKERGRPTEKVLEELLIDAVEERLAMHERFRARCRVIDGGKTTDV